MCPILWYCASGEVMKNQMRRKKGEWIHFLYCLLLFFLILRCVCVCVLSNRHKYMFCPYKCIRNFVLKSIDLISFSYYSVAFVFAALFLCGSVCLNHSTYCFDIDVCVCARSCLCATMHTTTTTTTTRLKQLERRGKKPRDNRTLYTHTHQK